MHLCQQFWQHGVIRDLPLGGHLRDNLTRGFIHTEMQFALGAPLLPAMLAHLPFALAKDLQAGRVNHQMQRLVPRLVRERHIKGGAATGNGALGGGRQIKVQQGYEGRDKALGLPQREVETAFSVNAHCTSASLEIVGRPT